MTGPRRAALIGLAVCLLALAAAPGARAANLGISGDSMVFNDPAAEANNISITRNAANYVVTDVVPIVTALPCANVIATVATCPVSAVTGTIDLEFGNNNDRAVLDATVTNVGNFFDLDILLEGGPGNDDLTGSPSAFNFMFGHTSTADGPGDDDLTGGNLQDFLIGGDGTDTLNGGGDTDIIDPGLGNDSANGNAGGDLIAGAFFLGGGSPGPDGADTIDGGTGFDQFQYFRINDVSLTLNGVADDGEGCPGGGCEGDNILATIESAGGGLGNDTLVGNGRTNGLFGDEGDDVINAGGGDDGFISGGNGDDVIRAGPGNDNQIDGGEGIDRMFGEGGDDSFFSTILTDDPDLVDGGNGIDLMDYSDADEAVRVSLDNRGNDGIEGENDNIRSDVEDVIGTEEEDVLIGSGRPNDLQGGDGNDRIVGKGSLDGLVGGRGNDRLSGGKGRDLLEGDAGRDRIGARDGGPDQVYCGSSVDLVLADRRDRTAADCDKVRRRRR